MGTSRKCGLKTTFPQGDSYTVLSLNWSSRPPFHLPHLRIGCGVGTGDGPGLQIVTARGQPRPMEEGVFGKKGSLSLERKPFGFSDNGD